LKARNESGCFFYGNPGYFCPKNNIGALARATLYTLLKYRNIVNKRKLRHL